MRSWRISSLPMVAFSSLFTFAALAPAALALHTPIMPSAAARATVISMQQPGTTLMPGDNSLDPAAGNFRRLSDALKDADIERRLEQEEIEKRENAAKMAREMRERRIALMRDIPDATAAGTVEDFMFKEGVKDILEKLDYDLIGLIPVKTRVREIASLLVVDKMRLKLGLETSVPSLHMGFTGAPGTGKTTVALRMGQILQRMGYCRTGHVVVATRDDLVGQYVGHTAPKTKEMVKKAMGGILLVDEAYYLYNAANDRDYGQESIEILLNVMENNKEDIIVVLAGYKDKMDKFYSYIPGMNSRIGNHIEFPNYEVEELVEIGFVMCRELEYTMDAAAVDAFRQYIAKRMHMPFFSNARTVRNAIDLARMSAAVRIFNEKMSPGSDGFVSDAELMTITAADFPSLESLEQSAIIA
uniref:AAA+ ATPase domain-containing protein n=1 Tax=Haptolina brevifila TaxID=156173 RepID=A0A7S2IY60_9EUKA